MVKSIWKEKPKPEDGGDVLFEQPDGPPHIVLAAAGLLLVFFLAGSIYLFLSGPFRGIDVVAPAELPQVSAIVTEFQGPLTGLEKKRNEVRRVLTNLGIEGGDAITIFPQSPFRMRPIRVSARVGYILPMNYPLEDLPEGVRQETIRPGNRLVVRVKGQGNFTGNKAYKAAVKALRPLGRAPDDGERFEVKVVYDGCRCVEHWVPVR